MRLNATTWESYSLTVKPKRKKTSCTTSASATFKNGLDKKRRGSILMADSVIRLAPCGHLIPCKSQTLADGILQYENMISSKCLIRRDNFSRAKPQRSCHSCATNFTTAIFRRENLTDLVPTPVGFLLMKTTRAG